MFKQCRKKVSLLGNRSDSKPSKSTRTQCYNKDRRLLDRQLPSIRRRKSGSPSGSTIPPSTVLVTCFQTCLLEYSSTILRKLWPSRAAHNYTTMKEKQSQRTRSRMWCSSTTSLITRRIFRRKSLCFNTLSPTWSKTTIHRKRSNSFRETNWTRLINCNIRRAPSTSKNGCALNTL